MQGSSDSKYRIFLLSPASCSGKKAEPLLSGRSETHLAQKLKSPEGAPLGEVFSYISALYFRGKIAYANAFARPPEGRGGVFVITPCAGLISPEKRISPEDLRRFAATDLDCRNEEYSNPLIRDLEALHAASPETLFILLGSISTKKYMEPLYSILGDRLRYPETFVGRGDMSRGGLMLRCVRSGCELEYVRYDGSVPRGKRPARLCNKLVIP